MSDTEVTEETDEDAPKKKSKLPLILGIVLALALGGGGFFVTYSGMLGGGGGAEEVAEEEHPAEALPPISFVEMEPLVISLGQGGSNTHLRFRGHLEVEGGEEESVTTLMPRVLDVLNSYLRALDAEDFEQPSAMIRLRAQMLRRVQLVVGEGRVRDLLVTEFILN